MCQNVKESMACIINSLRTGCILMHRRLYLYIRHVCIAVNVPNFYGSIQLSAEVSKFHAL